MTEARAIRANFSDWRTVKSRKSLQLIFEVPLEQQADVLKMLGAPLPDNPQWCGIALLQTPAEEPKQPDPDRSSRAKEQYRNLPPDKRMACDAARLCTDARFQKFATERKGMEFTKGDIAAHTADWMRRYLGVTSRSEIATNEAVRRKFEALQVEYETWAGLMPEQRF